MSDLPAPNTTHANITGKVPEWAKPKASRGARKGKRVRLSGDKRRHVSGLKKAGIISNTAAAKSGI